MENQAQQLDSFIALSLQVTCHAVNQSKNRDEARSLIKKTIARIGQQIAAAKAFIGSNCRLVLLPEYVLTSFPQGESIAVWSQKAALEMSDPLYDDLANIAVKHQIFLAGNAYENDPNFPHLYFQNCFIFAPSGNMVLRYRRLNSLFSPTPHDVLDRYLELYGIEGIFPVAKTSIGNLAAIASDEILFPEVARCLAMRGAEIFLHPTSEIYGNARSPKEAAKTCRAVENMAYIISCNTAGIVGTAIASSSVDGGSKIIDYRGLVLSETDTGESIAAYADIDLHSLRRYRRQSGMKNLLARHRSQIYTLGYDNSHFYPANTMVNGTIERQHFVNNQQSTIERLSELGII
ncbi:MAG TPA: nitrilase [Cyanothece sp. UBA12306]|nr:nitrilase [Cyanothece sp. UBA12306]